MSDKVREFLGRHGFIELSGDVNIQYGATFYRPISQQAVTIEDLNDASPPVNGNLVSLLSVYEPEDQQKIANALRSIGVDTLDGLDDQQKQYQVAYALIAYGSYDVEASATAMSEKGGGDNLYAEAVPGYGIAALLRAVKRVLMGG